MLEPLSGGLVTSRPASLLSSGELQRCDNLIYRPASPSLEQAPGQQVVAVTDGKNINGLRHAAFDNGLSLLVIQVTDAYYSTPAITPGAFTVLKAIVPGSSFESIHYNDRHYLLNGQDPNYVLLPDGTVRRHGLLPVTASPSALAGTGGAWPLTDDQLPAYYEYWTTEVYKSATEEIESTFVGSPTTVLVTNSSSTVTIGPPTPVNLSATHWRLYRSAAKRSSTDVAFPNGFQVGDDIVIATTVLVDGTSATTALTIAGAGEAAPSAPPWPPPAGYPVHGGWIDVNNIVIADGLYAVSPTVSNTDPAWMWAKNFGFTNIQVPVPSIVVEVKGYFTGSAILYLQLSWDGGISWTGRRTMYLPQGAPGVVQTLGGDWAHAWNTNEFLDAAFRVGVTAVGTVSGTVFVDYVKVQITHGKSTSAQITKFPTTDITVGDATFQDGAYGVPPAASFGDIFEDSLVVNDPINKGTLRYSIETYPEYFPPEYFLPLRTSYHDELTAIKNVGGALVVGLKTYVARVDYLPRAEDSEFSRGRAWSPITNSHGIVGKKTCTLFMIPGSGVALAYISPHGPMMTNGYQADTLTDDLNWPPLVNTSALVNCEFVNYPAEYKLVFYYTPNGATSNTKALHFYYHPSHIKNGKLKVTGPVDIASNGAVLAMLPDGSERLYTAAGQYIFAEGGVDVIPYVLETREIYPAGPGNAGEITTILLHQHGGGDVRVTPTVLDVNTEPREEQPVIVTAPSRGLAGIPFRVGCGGISFKVEPVSGGASVLDYLILDGPVFGVENYPA